MEFLSRKKNKFNDREIEEEIVKNDKYYFESIIFQPRLIFKCVSESFIYKCYDYLKICNVFKEIRKSFSINDKIILKDNTVIANIKELDLYEKRTIEEAEYVYNNLDIYKKSNAKGCYKYLMDTVGKLAFEERSINVINSNYHSNKNVPKITTSEIHYILTKKLSFKYDKSNIKGSSYDKSTQKLKEILFLRRLAQDIENGMNLQFFDELGIFNTSNKNYCWTHKGEDGIILKSKSFEKKHILMLCNTKRVIYYEMNCYFTNSNVVLDFFTNYFDITEKTELENTILILDNASYHRTDKVINLLAKKYKRVLFIPPLAPCLNMIEFCFALLKRQIYRRSRNEQIRNNREFTKTISKVIEEVKEEDINKLYARYVKEVIEYIDNL